MIEEEQPSEMTKELIWNPELIKKLYGDKKKLKKVKCKYCQCKYCQHH